METGNTLLDCLPLNVMQRLEPDLDSVKLERGHVLHSPGDAIRYLYFPVSSMISVTITLADGQIVEAGAAGSREVVGINAFMGGRETNQTTYVVQIAGEAIRSAAAPMKKEFDRNTEFRTIMLAYTQAMLAHVSQNVACNRIHAIDQRCARWLLEVRDRISSDNFPLTQELLGQMLGANRVSVNKVMNRIRDTGAIEFVRGDVRLTDLDKLRDLSCECFFVLAEEYNRLIGAALPVDPLNPAIRRAFRNP